MSQLGDYIRQFRKEHNNISIRDMALKCDLSSGYIHKLEKGIDPRTSKPIIPTIETIHKLSLGMNISIDELLELSGINMQSNSDTTLNELSNINQDLIDFWNRMKNSESFQSLIETTKDMDEKELKQVLRIIKAIEDDEANE